MEKGKDKRKGKKKDKTKKTVEEKNNKMMESDSKSKTEKSFPPQVTEEGETEPKASVTVKEETKDTDNESTPVIISSIKEPNEQEPSEEESYSENKASAELLDTKDEDVSGVVDQIVNDVSQLPINNAEDDKMQNAQSGEVKDETDIGNGKLEKDYQMTSDGEGKNGDHDDQNINKLSVKSQGENDLTKNEVDRFDTGDNSVKQQNYLPTNAENEPNMDKEVEMSEEIQMKNIENSNDLKSSEEIENPSLQEGQSSNVVESDGSLNEKLFNDENTSSDHVLTQEHLSNDIANQPVDQILKEPDETIETLPKPHDVESDKIKSHGNIENSESLRNDKDSDSLDDEIDDILKAEESGDTGIENTDEYKEKTIDELLSEETAGEEKDNLLDTSNDFGDNKIRDDTTGLFDDSKEHDRISKSSIADDLDKFLDDDDDDEAVEDALTDQLLTQQLPNANNNNQTPNVETLAYESEYLTRKIQEGRDNEKHLKREIDDKQRKVEDAERKIKDLQIRLIRFARDDEAKDKHVATLEREMKEINSRLEEVLDEHQQRVVAQQQQQVQQQNGGKAAQKQQNNKSNKQSNAKSTNVTDSKTCAIL